MSVLLGRIDREETGVPAVLRATRLNDVLEPSAIWEFEHAAGHRRDVELDVFRDALIAELDVETELHARESMPLRDWFDLEHADEFGYVGLVEFDQAQHLEGCDAEVDLLAAVDHSWETPVFMTYTCPQCGDDVTEQVLRKQRTVRVGYRTAYPPFPPPPPVVVTCINGHIAGY